MFRKRQLWFVMLNTYCRPQLSNFLQHCSMIYWIQIPLNKNTFDTIKTCPVACHLQLLKYFHFTCQESSFSPPLDGDHGLFANIEKLHVSS